MIHDEVVAVEEEDGLFTNPWPAAQVGVGATFGAFVLAVALPALGVVWVPLMLIGLLAAASAIVIRPKSSLVLANGALVSLLCLSIASKSQWDPSATMFFGILAVLSVLTAVVLQMPAVWQKVFVSLFLLFHFLGILSAVTSAPPGSWLSHQVWTRVFRPYLEFMYLNNAYHFYAPDPGPAVLLWCYVEYEPDVDAKGEVTRRYYRWLKIPDLDDNGRVIDYDAEGNPRTYPNVNYTRRLSLVEAVNQQGPPAPPPDASEMRVKAGLDPNKGIPTQPNTPLPMQYREPGTLSKLWLESYAKRIANVYKHKDHPEKKVTSIKIYKVLHRILSAGEVAEGRDMYDPLTYEPVFMGEYSPKGELLSRKVVKQHDQQGVPFVDAAKEFRDPYLYWVIPIMDDRTAALGIYAEPVKDGIKVEVMRGRAAHRAGLVSGDVIVAIDNRRVRDLDELRSEIQQHQLPIKAGDKPAVVSVRVRHADGSEGTYDVELMRRVINYLKIHAGEIEEGVQL